MDLGLCLSVYGDLSKLSGFVSSETTKLVGKLADLDIETARITFQDRTVSSNPSREIEATITHLQSAHTKYIDLAESLWVRFLSYTLFGSTKRFESYRKSSDSSLLIGLCYRLLNEPILELKYLKQGLQEFEKSVELEVDLLQVLVMNPYSVGDQETVKIRQKELEKMRDDIVKLLDHAEKNYKKNINLIKKLETCSLLSIQNFRL